MNIPLPQTITFNRDHLLLVVPTIMAVYGLWKLVSHLWVSRKSIAVGSKSVAVFLYNHKWVIGGFTAAFNLTTYFYSLKIATVSTAIVTVLAVWLLVIFD